MPSSHLSIAAAAEFYRKGDLLQAERICRALIESEPRDAEAWNLLGALYKRAKRGKEAVQCFERALQLEPDRPAFHNNLGEWYREEGRYNKAEGCFRETIRLDPQYVFAYNNLSLSLQSLDRNEEALGLLREAIRIEPKYATAYNNLGTMLREEAKLDEAAEAFRKAIEFRPDYAAAHNGLGAALQDLNDLEGALRHFERALELNPRYAKALYNLGNTHHQRDEEKKAAACFQRALRLSPDYAEAMIGLSLLLSNEEKSKEALSYIRKAAELKAESAEVHYAMGNILSQMRNQAGAIQAYQRALKCKPDFPEALANIECNRAEICDWSERDEALKQIFASVEVRLAEGSNSPVEPFSILAPLLTPEKQLEVARQKSSSIEKQSASLQRSEEFVVAERSTLPRQGPRRLRVGYFSPNYKDHPQSHLIQALFGLHHRETFEVFNYSFGNDDGSVYRQRIERDSEHFIEVRGLNDVDTARRIHNDEIDILVDLAGYTGPARPRVGALRPAPIEVSFLEYPGTMGADFIDYLIADRVIIPAELEACYHEHLVFMPHTYQINDHEQAISERVFSRTECGLPEEGSVFCCFNRNEKIEPTIYDLWMKILAQVPGSVLWLIAGSEEAKGNLRREAEARGVSGERIIFAGQMPKPEHFARHRCADLFLDTLYYNAHTTASDALWSGLPVLTTPGRTFAARVAASLLTAVGLPELIVDDFSEYERTAVALARVPERLAALKAKLEANRKTQPLFDTPRFVRNLEKAYST